MSIFFLNKYLCDKDCHLCHKRIFFTTVLDKLKLSPKCKNMSCDKLISSTASCNRNFKTISLN